MAHVMAPPHRSLVIAPQWIGDAVMSEPLMARLAGRGEHLTVAALPWVAPVYQAMPQVAEVIALPFAHGRLDWAGRRQLAAQWRGRFDTAYVLPNSIKAALLPWLARIPRRVGYRGEGRWGLLNQRLPNPPGRPPMVAFYNALASVGVSAGAIGSAGEPEAGVLSHADSPERPRLQVPEAQRLAATAKVGVTPDQYWVFAPGAEYGPAKCWPAEHYASLARQLHQQHGMRVLLLGSAKEVGLCEQIAQAAPGACQVVAGQTSLLEAMALIAASRGMVSNDSGLMHMAAAFGRPQAALFGSTSPEHTPPLNPHAQVLWLKQVLQLDCAPCFARVCQFGHTRCLAEIDPQRVALALQESVKHSLAA
jgi:heptosyltransferase II